MKRNLRRLAVFFFVVGALCSYRIVMRRLPESLAASLQAEAKRSNVVLDIADIKLHLLSLEASSVGIIFPVQGMPVPLRLQDVSISLDALPLLIFRTSGQFGLNLYGGDIRGEFQRKSNQIALHANARGVDLGQHPIPATFGLAGKLSSKIDGELTELRPGYFVPEEGKLLLQLESGVFQAKGLPIPLPGLSELDAKIAVEKHGKVLLLKEASAKAREGELTGKGSFRLSPEMLVMDGSAELSIRLSAEGKKSLGGYLALAAQGDITKPAEGYTISIQVQEGRAKTVVTSKIGV